MNIVTDFNKDLKQKLKKYISSKFSVSLLTQSKNSNPYIIVRVVNWKEDIISNDLRKLVAETLNYEGILNWDDIHYGNVTKTSITLHYSEWKEFLLKL